jgi:ATP-dependent Clp protease ATP-binding subunit ClpC
VLLLGEPGVGKTAIAEGLARRIEFEPDRVPVRLRDCQIVNLQMNTMVPARCSAACSRIASRT